MFTIAIPTYNNVDTISKTIDSALSQTSAEKYEILIVNNASTDGTRDLLDGYRKYDNLKIVENKSTCTLFENHNVCLREASNSYILFCHADDTLDHKALEILKNHLKNRNFPEHYIVWGHSMFRDYSSTLLNAGLRPGEMFAGIVAARPFLNAGLTPSGTCYSKSFIDIGGFFPMSYRTTPSDSSSMVYAALKGFRFEMIQDIVFYRYDATTAHRKLDPVEKVRAFFDAYDSLFKLIEKNKIIDLLSQSSNMKNRPLPFYSAASTIAPKESIKAILKTFVKQPYLLKNKESRLFITAALKNLIS
jgi:glycosyltransferase involved in cell wall biosynthesis